MTTSLYDTLHARSDEIAERVASRLAAERADGSPSPVDLEAIRAVIAELLDVDRVVPEAVPESMAPGEDTILWIVLREVIEEMAVELGGIAVVTYKRLSDEITERASRALRRHVEATERARIDVSSRHVGFLVHDLSNLVASASASLTWWRSDPSVADVATASIDTALHELTVLLDRELTVARLETVRAGMCPRSEPVMVADLVAASEHDVRALAATRDITLAFRIDPGLLVLGDSRLLRAAISNLVNNAVRFTRQVSTVHVRAHRTEHAVVIEIADACGGIAPAVAARLGDTRAAARGAPGLGFSVARQAIEAHGGELTVEPLVGDGCVVRVLLPRAP